MKPVATDWFQHERLAPDLIRITEKHFDPIARANLWLLSGRNGHLLIDNEPARTRLPGKRILMASANRACSGRS